MKPEELSKQAAGRGTKKNRVLDTAFRRRLWHSEEGCVEDGGGGGGGGGGCL
jgi:hypothetical protein